MTDTKQITITGYSKENVTYPSAKDYTVVNKGYETRYKIKESTGYEQWVNGYKYDDEGVLTTIDYTLPEKLDRFNRWLCLQTFDDYYVLTTAEFFRLSRDYEAFEDNNIKVYTNNVTKSTPWTPAPEDFLYANPSTISNTD